MYIPIGGDVYTFWHRCIYLLRSTSADGSRWVDTQELERKDVKRKALRRYGQNLRSAIQMEPNGIRLAIIGTWCRLARHRFEDSCFIEEVILGTKRFNLSYVEFILALFQIHGGALPGFKGDAHGFVALARRFYALICRINAEQCGGCIGMSFGNALLEASGFGGAFNFSVLCPKSSPAYIIVGA